MALSSDGRNVYAAGSNDDGISIFARSLPPVDIDGDGAAQPLSDGLLLVRYLFGFRGATLITGAVSGSCTRCTAELIEAYIAGTL